MKRLARHSLGAKAFGTYSAIKKNAPATSCLSLATVKPPPSPSRSQWAFDCVPWRGGAGGLPREGWAWKGKRSVHLLSSPLSAQCCGVIHCEASPLSQEAGPQRHCSSCGLLITATLPVIRLPWTECRNGEQSRGNLRAFSQGKFMSVRSDNTKTRLVPRASFLLYFSSYLFSHS